MTNKNAVNHFRFNEFYFFFSSGLIAVDIYNTFTRLSGSVRIFNVADVLPLLLILRTGF